LPGGERAVRKDPPTKSSWIETEKAKAGKKVFRGKGKGKRIPQFTGLNGKVPPFLKGEGGNGAP